MSTGPLADFIRNATPEEKQAVYSGVMRRVAIRQAMVLDAAGKDLLRITAPHFCAGIVPQQRAAPILQWMVQRGWSEQQIQRYCISKGWSIERLPNGRQHDQSD